MIDISEPLTIEQRKKQLLDREADFVLWQAEQAQIINELGAFGQPFMYCPMPYSRFKK